MTEPPEPCAKCKAAFKRWLLDLTDEEERDRGRTWEWYIAKRRRDKQAGRAAAERGQQLADS